MSIKTDHPLKAIRRAGVPLIAYETSDPAASIAGCVEALNGKREETKIIQWNICTGQQPMTELAQSLKMFSQHAEPIQEPSAFLCELYALARKITDETTKQTEINKALIFVHNAHLYMRGEQFIQAIWNLRDPFAAIGATLVLLCPNASLPVELQNDVVIVTEPLPDAETVNKIVDTIAISARIDVKKIKNREKIVDTMLGISAFAAEQALSLSVDKDGFDQEQLWERKRKMVEQTPGLTVWRGDKSGADSLGGLVNAKKYLHKLLTSDKNPVRAIMFLDEIEKLLGGATGDLSGVAQDQLKVILTEMQDGDIPGILLLGPPGTGKTALGRYAAAVADAEFIGADTGAMTGSLVGESQAKIRAAFKTFKAVAQGKAMIIATCNSIGSLPPELRRRFTMGTFFVDLPSKEERKAIWPIWKQKFNHDVDLLEPNDEGWTGAEIKACCEISYRMGMSLLDASKYVVPVSKSAADRIERLRVAASGNYIDASADGIYQHKPSSAPTGRKIETVALTVTSTEQQKEQE